MVFFYILGRLKEKREYIWHLLDVQVGGIGLDREEDDEGGYLILIRCDQWEVQSKLWTGDVIEIESTADSTITLSRVLVKWILGL